MADLKISAFTEITTLADGDSLPVVDVSVPETKKITKANFKADMVTNAANEYTKNQNLDSKTLTIDTGNVAVDFETDGNAKLILDANATLSAPSNLKDGTAVVLLVTQDATGGRTLSFNAAYDFAGKDSAVNPTASAKTLYLFINDGTSVYALKIWEDD
jgi:hypothetical protein